MRGEELETELSRVFAGQISSAYNEGLELDEDQIIAYATVRVSDALRDYFQPGRWGYNIYCATVSGPIFELYVDIAPRDIEVSRMPSSIMMH